MTNPHKLTLLIILLLFASPALADTCYESVLDIPEECSAGNLSAIHMGSCTQITCDTGDELLQVLACDKPDMGPKMYFEMYKQVDIGDLELCLTDTCISDNGYARSPDYPICVPDICIPIPGDSGEVELEGDAFRIETGYDLLELRESIGEVYDTLTDSELEALFGGSITTDEGSTDYYQYLRFAEADYDDLQPVAVNFLENENDVLADFLVVDDNEPFFEWEIEFTEGLVSEISNGQLEDLHDESLYIIGEDYLIVDASIQESGAVILELLTGTVQDTLREGETRTYGIDGVDYEVTLVFVSDPGNATPVAKFSVNGELTDSLALGDIDTLSGGLTIGVTDILVNSREGVVSFILDVKKVDFSDFTTSSESFDGFVEINGENIEDADIAIIGTFLNPATFEITNVKYRLTADAAYGSTVYVPSGSGVKEYLDEPEGMLSETLDLRYEGLKEVETNPIEIDARSDHSYDFTATNIRGKEYSWPFVTTQGGVFKWGDDDDDFWFIEPSGYYGDMPVDAFFVTDDDYFALSENSIDNADEKDDSAILRYSHIDTFDQIVTFTDMATGEQRNMPYVLSDKPNLLGRGVVVAEGNAYTVFVSNLPGNPLAVDVNGDAAFTGERVGFTAWGGIIIDFDDQGQQSNSTSSIPFDNFYMDFTVQPNQFDDAVLGGEEIEIEIFADEILEEINLAYNGYSGPNEGIDIWNHFQLINDDMDDDWERGMTDYGILIELYDPPSDYSDPRELYLTAPEQQLGAQVFVVAGSVNATQTGGCCYQAPRELPPYLLAIANEGSSEDVLAMFNLLELVWDVDSLAELCNPLAYGDMVLFSDVDGLDLDGQVTLTIWNQSVFIIVGETSPTDHVIFAIELAGYLDQLDIPYDVILSSDVPSSDLHDLYITEPPVCEVDSVHDTTAYCTGGNISVDVSAGSCRTVECASQSETLKVLACDKPDGQVPDYFEMYRQQAAEDIEICLDETCISNNGFARSDDFTCTMTDPVCGDGVVEFPEECDGSAPDGYICTEECTLEALPPPTNSSLDLRVADWFPQGLNVVYICEAQGFEATYYDWTFGDGHEQQTDADNVWHTYAASGNYTVTCSATDGDDMFESVLDIALG